MTTITDEVLVERSIPLTSLALHSSQKKRPHGSSRTEHRSTGEEQNAHRHQDAIERTPSLLEVTTSEDDRVYPNGVEFWLTTFIVAFLLILGGVDTNIVATAVPSITDEFHTVADIGWYSSAFRLSTCAFQFIFGKLYHLFSVKHTVLLANAILLIGSVLCATAVNSTMFIVGRAVSGIGFAGLMSGGFIILTYTLPLRKRPLYCGALGAVESASILAAPILGGKLTQSLGWRWCFWINLPIAGATWILTLLVFPDPKPSNKNLNFKQKLLELNLPSNLLFIPSLTSLFIALSWAGTKYNLNNGKFIGGLVAFAVLSSAFSFYQYKRGDAATLPSRILKNRNIIAGALFTAGTNSAINVLEYYLPTYYQVVREYSPARSGYMMIPIVVGSIVGAFFCGTGTTTLGYYTPFMIFASVTMPVFAGLITSFNVDTSFPSLILYSGSLGFSTAIGFNAPFSAVQTVLPSEDVPMGLSILLFAQHFGPAVFVAVAQVIFMRQLSSNLNQLVPGLDHTILETNGLTEFFKEVPVRFHGQVVAAVDASLSQTWYLAVGLTGVTLLGSVFMEWRSVKQKKD